MKTPKFKAAKGSRFSDKDVQVIGPELHKLSQEHGGVDANTIVAYAADHKNPLHPYFEWDDTKAAAAHRLWQARVMASSVLTFYVETKGGEETVKTPRAFYALDVGEKDDGGEKPQKKYVSLVTVLNDTNMIEQVISQAERELRTWQEKYATYSSYRQFKQRLGRVSREIVKLKQKRKRQPSTAVA